MNLANKLTLMRLILIPVMVIVYYIQFPFNETVAAAIFAIACLTDFLDGYVARKYNMVTDFGKFVDPIADKVLVTTALIMIVDAHIVNIGVINLLIVVCVAIIIARELIISGFRSLAANKGIVIAADKLGKYKAFFQDIAIIVIFVAINFPINGILVYVGLAILGVATILTIISAISYFIKNRAVLSGHLVKKEDAPQDKTKEEN